ncbi:hypothetical protein [Spiroplasma cantharicola]|uniref:Uncharacterized protein n=1 Tax=Spiroplasma cantharicola TaxID=362837 RepID=A0A0M5KC88_9MOLU|nr:hypothetical protein [Spiroplasma cantharicola]ALD66301.1 hypothetical protein SCANT_v1c03910 [Spiroplasma cantharicola]
MIKLLSLIGALGISSSTVAPAIIIQQNSNNIISTDIEQGSMRIDVKNEKHFDKDGKIILGTRDYKEVLIEAIDKQRAFNKENNVSNFDITDSITRFPGTAENGKIRVGRSLKELVNAKEYEVLSMEVTIAKSDNSGNYKYGINFEGLADGRLVTGDLYGYQWDQGFADFQIKPGYVITLITEYKVSERIDHTDKMFNSNIYLPDLGIKFTALQIIEMFNYEKGDLNKQAITYINSTKNTKIDSINSLKLYKAIKKDNSFEKGEAILNNTIIDEEYFFVSFESKDAIGTFNMLVHK